MSGVFLAISARDTYSLHRNHTIGVIMEYNFWADALSKYHTSIPLIQALIVLAAAGTVTAVAFCLCYAVKAFSPYQEHHRQSATLEGAISMTAAASAILLAIRKDPHFKLTPERHAMFEQGREAAHQLYCLFEYAERKHIEKANGKSEQANAITHSPSAPLAA